MNLALNPFNKGRKPEVIEKVEIEENWRLESLIKTYKEVKRNVNKLPMDRFDWCTVPPVYIDMFLQWLIVEDEVSDRGTAAINYLIHKSFNARWIKDKDFVLSPGTLKLDCLCGGISRDIFMGGYSEGRCKVTINGDVGGSFGVHSKYCDFIIKGDADDFLGESSRYCTYVANNVGSAAGSFGFRNVIMAENFGESLGTHSTYSVFLVKNDYKSLAEHISGKFIAYNKKVLSRLCKDVPLSSVVGYYKKLPVLERIYYSILRFGAVLK
ncbi:hypothetical protein KY330_05815 [Candidatus Woesearchaeota archaeon]|nr:hypothetical protein [Candidatus Woesearchaeota archaeon]